MKKLLVVLLLAMATNLSAQHFQLSESARFSILTLGPDQDEFYEAFGHSAIRLTDPVNNIDYAFNYGEFSFHQPNFYLNFAKGHLNYSLGVVSYPDFREAYIYYNRYIHEQVLALNHEQAQKVFEFLMWNARQENKYYLYDYFFNNCSTKIRDVFKDVLNDDIQFDQSYIKPGPTIRQLTDLYLNKQPWGDLGIDIGLGSRIDQQAAPYEYMFLPDYLEFSFDHAKVRSNGVMVPVVKEKVEVYQAKPEDDAPGWMTPFVALGVLLIATTVITYFDFKRRKISRWLNFIFLLVTGFLGVVLMLLWFATDHHACARNLNIAWALPTNLIVAAIVFRKSRPNWVAIYFKCASGILALLLIGWMFLPQQINGFLYPFLVALLMRYLANVFIKPQAAS